ncbi:uncharacterized protein BO88DRAFT_54376 [Aspergillus vadensis CBS 113365]|uniref:Uncharacterized protein n=1 Tax=Aspergillus vadensis (strain CBS 113365 / IMI 142717 / IBT 24658) TaxID=1448311 RepID=A0A319CKW7_ASPVC|nr:hypothetical protein BO88DRAFT_54376 [Aspergillus vadensis CBS 113365]PYH68942.1 hypothetical protein BO88DRAFT_54376 [Aspergillus vadensis CBS 113365]
MYSLIFGGGQPSIARDQTNTSVFSKLQRATFPVRKPTFFFFRLPPFYYFLIFRFSDFLFSLIFFFTSFNFLQLGLVLAGSSSSHLIESSLSLVR